MSQTTEKNTKKLKSWKNIHDFEGKPGRPNIDLRPNWVPEGKNKDSGVTSADSWGQEQQLSSPIPSQPIIHPQEFLKWSLYKGPTYTILTSIKGFNIYSTL